MSKLYLIPTTLGEGNINNVLPIGNFYIINELKYFIVENIRSSRRFLKHINKDINIDNLTFFEFNEHTDLHQITNYVKLLENGNDVGIISEAGCPCTADPGGAIVEIVHKKGIQVVPLVGPSSILLALMASGFNGQNFAFNGYLPIEQNERIRKLKSLENRAIHENQTQIFIETPYRNNAMKTDIIQNLNRNTKLCIASNITTQNEFIKSLFISDWRQTQIDLHKKPTIFLIYK